MTLQELHDNLDKIWSSPASTDMDNARRKAERDGHKYRVIDREGFRAALARIIEEQE